MEQEKTGFGKHFFTTPLVDATPFVGRQADLGKLRALLTTPEIRLVTILGPGGIGKTRLAQELAASLQGKFSQGVVFISLAGLNASDDIVPVLAAALDVQIPLEGDLHQAVLNRLSPRQVLLVFDNFEQLVEQALFVHEILVSAKQVRVLVTSREKLNLQGETLYHLDGLQLPLEIETLEESDAIRLFLQRTRQACPNYVLNSQDAPHIIHICRLVQGMPLGILLAAAWMEHFSPQEIAVQMERSLDFLAREFRDLPERHRSLRAVFDSSFARLDETQRAAWRRLAVFRGGFTAQAAEAVAGADLRILLSLVEKSLLQRNIHTGRFDLHELLRQYAREKLTEASENEQIGTLHASYYLGFVSQSGPQLKSSQQTTVLDAFQNDWENISQAWQWAVEHRDLCAIELATPALYAFCDMRSRYHTGKSLFGLARQTLSPSPADVPFPAWGLLLLSWYDMLTYLERPALNDEVTAQTQACLTRARQCGSELGVASSLVLLGAIAADRAEYETAARYCQEGMRLQPMLDDFYWVSLRIGICQQLNGQYQDSLDSFRVGLARAQALGERVKTGWALLNMGNTYSMLGENAQAESHLCQALEMFEAIGTTAGCMIGRYSLAGVALAEGRPVEARKLVKEALEIAGQIHSHLWEGQLNDLLKRIGMEPAALEGQPRAALSEPLSDRELEILHLLKSDLDGPEIARELSISLNTLRFHTKNIYRKLRATNRREVVRQAENLNL
jgi:predicted ATPase/DNA-binding CsgD family transcriptional regulator